MNKVVHFLRHAKASDERGMNDTDRPLTDRGVRAAILVGVYMKQSKIIPSLILCSSAKRTRQTMDHLLAQSGIAAPAKIDDRLYLADANRLTAVIAETDDSISQILVIAHNPGLQVLAAEMAKTGDETLIDKLHESFSPGALCSIEFLQSSWADIWANHKTGKILRFIAPYDLI